MKDKIGKYGVWLSQNEMSIIEKSLEWLENSSHVFNETSKIGAIKNLQNDLQKIKDNGPQIPKKVEISNDEYYESQVECKECD
tara:strand:+ start:375 stop:623 length:249 start_codon:yes stop_codon:yes gene_type:complete